MLKAEHLGAYPKSFHQVQKKKKGYYAGDAKWRYNVKPFGKEHPLTFFLPLTSRTLNPKALGAA